MEQTEKPVDMRVRRTRLLLLQAFQELMGKKNFQSITVQDIATQAMVNRATFYDHFTDKYALLEYMVREWFRATLDDKLTDRVQYSVENLHLLMLTMCEFFDHLHGKCKPSDPQLLSQSEAQAMTLVQALLVSWLKVTAPGGPGHQTSPEVTAAIMSWAIYGAARYWSQGDRKEPAAQFVSRVLPSIEGILRR